MTDKTFYTPQSIPVEENKRADSNQGGNHTPELKDYFCPFCGNKLFRGNVKQFKQVCIQCNRLVDSSKINDPTSRGDSEVNK